MRGCVLMASYNESRAIAPVLAEIDEAARALRPSGIELSVTLLDEGSADGTADVAADVAKHLDLDFEVIIAARTTVGRATMNAFSHALAGDAFDFIVTLDADGQHDGRQIPDLVRAFLARDSGMTIGSRWMRGGRSPGTGPARSLLSRLGNVLVRRVTGVRGVHDATTSFRVYRPDVARLLTPDTLRVDGYGFFSAFVAIAQAHGFTVDEVPITFRPRYSGVQQLARADLVDFAKGLLTTRRQVDEIRRAMRSNQALWAQRSARLQPQGASTGSTFGATEELTNLAGAGRFLEWIAAELAVHLGHRVLEVGAGLGAITRQLAAVDPSRQIVALEPAANLYDDLVANTADVPSITALQHTSADLLAAGGGPFDSVVYVSVLEHILDDTAELRTARDLLVPGGTVALFVPAMPALYGSLDYKSGHFRRYDKQLLRSVIEAAGLEVVDLHYLDVAGAVPYWLMYRLLNRKALDTTSSRVYDSLIVPASKAIQRAIPEPPLGKNLVAVARRP